MRIETSFLFDLDGTLVDSVYQHVLAWYVSKNPAFTKKINGLSNF